MRAILLVTTCLALAACGKTQERNASVKLNAFEASEPAFQQKEAETPAEMAPLKVNIPKLAYSYKYSFVLPGSSIARAQQVHVALCERLGIARCQMLSLDSDAGDARSAKATLKLRVASAVARHFGNELEKSISDTGGHATGRSVTAEDVSKDMSDTDARLRQRELLVARLTEVLRTHQGKVAELVEAERSVATAQEEIDQARSWLAELQGRVAMSTIEIEYTAAAPAAEHVGNGIGDAFSASANAFMIGIGGIARVLIFVAPWAMLAALGWWILWRARPLWQRASHYEPGAENDEPETGGSPS